MHAKENRQWIRGCHSLRKGIHILSQDNCIQCSSILADDSSASTDLDLDRYQTMIESAKLDLQSCFQELLVASAEIRLWTQQELVEEKARKKMLKDARAEENNKIRESYHKILQANKRLIEAHYKVPMAPNVSAINKLLQPR